METDFQHLVALTNTSSKHVSPYMFKYLIHLKPIRNKLLAEACELSDKLSIEGVDSWVNFNNSFLSFLNITVDIRSDCKYLCRNVLKALVKKVTLLWKDKITCSCITEDKKCQSNKLRIYALF